MFLSLGAGGCCWVWPRWAACGAEQHRVTLLLRGMSGLRGSAPRPGTDRVCAAVGSGAPCCGNCGCPCARQPVPSLLCLSPPCSICPLPALPVRSLLCLAPSMLCLSPPCSACPLHTLAVPSTLRLSPPRSACLLQALSLRLSKLMMFPCVNYKKGVSSLTELCFHKHCFTSVCATTLEYDFILSLVITINNLHNSH